MPTAKVHRISARAPDDVGCIEQAIAEGRIRPEGIRAVFGKTEGNDGIDVGSVHELLARLDLAAPGQLTAAQRERVVAVLAKAGPSRSGLLRGYRHTMLDDSDISATRHARAFVCGALASVVGHAELFVSGGAEHQGPDGGGPVAVIVKRRIAV